MPVAGRRAKIDVPMASPAKDTFEYTFDVADGAGPLVPRPAPELCARLVGPSPTLTIGPARPLDHRLPSSIDLSGLAVRELVLSATARELATLERASFDVPAALVGMLIRGDELHLVRPGLADVALWLVRDGSLILAAGALLGAALGPEASIDLEGDALRVTVDGVPALLGTEPRPRSPLGRGACVALARRDACDPQIATAAALLLHHGPFRMLPWVRRRRT
jgi:hypothetical protein